MKDWFPLVGFQPPKVLEILLIIFESHEGAPGSWDHLIQQSGMFGFLGLSPEVVLKLRGRRGSPPPVHVLMRMAAQSITIFIWRTIRGSPLQG